jgi:hypothetical protein
MEAGFGKKGRVCEFIKVKAGTKSSMRKNARSPTPRKAGICLIASCLYEMSSPAAISTCSPTTLTGLSTRTRGHWIKPVESSLFIRPRAFPSLRMSSQKMELLSWMISLLACLSHMPPAAISTCSQSASSSASVLGIRSPENQLEQSYLTRRSVHCV